MANALLTGYILGEYTEQNCPRYLKRENYAKMQRFLRAGKLHLFHGSIEQAIIKNRDQREELFTVASLLVRCTECAHGHLGKGLRPRLRGHPPLE